MKVATYVLAVKQGEQGPMELASKGMRNFDMPVCFTPEYAAHLFHFSESRVQCKEGDAVFLLQGDVDISEISSEENFPEAFKNWLAQKEDLHTWTILEQKFAESVHSKAYKQRVRDDLERTHRLLQSKQVLI